MNPHTVSFSVRKLEKAVVATVGASRLGYEEIDSFGEQLSEIVGEYSEHQVVLNLSLVSTLSSIVIGKIFKARKALIDGGGKLVIVASTPAVIHVLQACQLDNIIGVFETVEDAVK